VSLAALAVPAHVPLAVATRGGTVESIHFGSVAVADRTGRVVRSAGDPNALTFTRSALKPVRALPFVACGGIERFGFSPPQVALLCASHSGEPRHVDGQRRGLVPAVVAVLDQLGLRRLRTRGTGRLAASAAHQRPRRRYGRAEAGRCLGQKVIGALTAE
jgi:hypothetical protein